MLTKQKDEAAKRGRQAGLAWIITGAVAGATLFGAGSWLLTAVGVGVSGYLTRRWFRYRAEWGLRF
jgi:hypothetical protein